MMWACHFEGPYANIEHADGSAQHAGSFSPSGKLHAIPSSTSTHFSGSTITEAHATAWAAIYSTLSIIP